MYSDPGQPGQPDGIVSDGTSTSEMMLVVSRTNANLLKMFKNGVLEATETATNTFDVTTMTQKVLLWQDGTGAYSRRRMGFASIGYGLTDTDAANLSDIVNDFNYTLGRSISGYVPTITPTPTPTITPTISLTPTITPTITVTPTITPSASPAPSCTYYELARISNGSIYMYYIDCEGVLRSVENQQGFFPNPSQYICAQSYGTLTGPGGSYVPGTIYPDWTATTLGSCALVTSGLTLYLDASEITSYPGTGTIWSDISGNNNHFVLTGDSGNIPQFSYTGTPASTGTTGIFSVNSATTATSEYFFAPDSPSLSPTQAISIEAWYLMNGAGAHKTVVNKNNTTGSDPQHGDYALRTYGTGQNEMWIAGYFTGPEGTVNQNSTDVWVQVVMTWNSTDKYYRYYINGVLYGTVGPTVATSIPNGNGTYMIGNGASTYSPYNYPVYMSGFISILRQYDRQLSIDEIRMNFATDRIKFINTQ
jgi:hypothetical protein